MNSFVTFIGSGPGNPELLTIKAVDRLKNAKVILYDDLSSGDILKYANKNAILVSVGKRAGLHSPKQTLVNKLLIEYASRNTNIVRLKSGDCGIFGRLEEEIEALQNQTPPHKYHDNPIPRKQLLVERVFEGIRKCVDEDKVVDPNGNKSGSSSGSTRKIMYKTP